MLEQTFPFIGRMKTSPCTIVLFYNEKNCDYMKGASGVVLESKIHKIGHFSDDWSLKVFSDITKEYLKNIRVEIKSEEQSEFIQKLAFSYGYKWRDFEFEESPLVRHTNKNFLVLNSDTVAYSDYIFGDEEEKEFFIPLLIPDEVEQTTIEPKQSESTKFDIKLDLKDTRNTYLLKNIEDFNKLNESTQKNLGIPEFPCIAVGIFERDISNHDYNYTFLSIKHFEEVAN